MTWADCSSNSARRVSFRRRMVPRNRSHGALLGGRREVVTSLHDGVSETCIFCDNPPDSGEHLWSNWMGPLLQRPWHKSRFELVQNYSYEAAPFGEVAHWTHNGATHKKKIRVVCEQCNNGWMNKLECARHFLKPMILGESIALDSAAQRAIAEWIVLKLLVLEHDPTGGQKPTPIFSRRQRLAFKNNGQIPQSFRIWLCARGGPKWHDSLALSGGRLLLSSRSGRNIPRPGPGRNAQSVTWGMRSLLIHSFAVTYSYLDSRLTWDGPPCGVRLWPMSGHEIEWPSGLFLTDNGADTLADQFPRLAKSLPRSK